MATALSRELSGEEISNNKTPNDESAFQNWIRGTDWFKEFKAEYNEEPDLDTKDYDYRAAWKAGVQPERDPYDNNRFHWPSSLPTGEMLKSAEHPTAWKEYFMRDTGVNPDALGLKTQEDANIYLKKKSDQKAPSNKGSAMSTTLDRINNPLSPLGLTSLMGSPNKENPAAPKFGEDDVGTMEGRLSAGRSRLANLQIQEAGLSTRQANLTTDLANLTAQKLAYDRQKEEFGAKQRVEESRANYDNIKKIFDDEINSPQYKEKQRINKEIAEYQVFAPTEVTAPMLGVLFAAIGATGMLLGGNSKNNAKAALSAMNGMAEGFGKGREQYDKERKTAFDTNVKLLQTKLSAIKDGLEDARREAVLNKQAADQKVRETLAANEAQFLQENTNKRGLESTIALVDGQLKNINQATNLLSSKISQLTGQLDSKETQILMRKIDAASRESEKRIAAEQRQRELEQRQKKLTPVGMQGDNIVMADELGNITLVPTEKGFVPKPGIQRPEPRTPAPRTGVQDGQLVQLPDARTLPPANVSPGAPPLLSPAAAAKAGQGEKAPAGIEKDIKQNAIIAENMRSTISSAEDLAKKGKLKSFGFIEGRIPYDIVQQFTSPEELRFIAQMNSLTNQQLKLQSGATVTAAEFARQKGVLPLVTDKPETVVIKLKLWQDLIDTETKVLGRAYPETVKKYSGATPDRLAERMDQAGATPGGSEAEERSQAQSAILKIQNSQLSPEEKQKRVKSIESSYKERNGREL